MNCVKEILRHVSAGQRACKRRFIDPMLDLARKKISKRCLGSTTPCERWIIDPSLDLALKHDLSHRFANESFFVLNLVINKIFITFVCFVWMLMLYSWKSSTVDGLFMVYSPLMHQSHLGYLDFDISITFWLFTLQYINYIWVIYIATYQLYFG